MPTGLVEDGEAYLYVIVITSEAWEHQHEAVIKKDILRALCGGKHCGNIFGKCCGDSNVPSLDRGTRTHSDRSVATFKILRK